MQSFDSTATIVMYPDFNNLGTGNTSVLIQNLYSEELGNVRDIAVYVPNSISENYLRRKVNVLVLLDGDSRSVDYFAQNGGRNRNIFHHYWQYQVC